MFKIMEKIFVPSYGAGTILNIEDKETTDGMKKFYVISLAADHMNLLLPESKLKDYRIRYISEENKVKQAISVIGEKPIFIEKKWNKRYRENSDKIASGEIRSECEVLRDLYYLKKIGNMPPGEMRILEKAENMVVSEIMLCMDISIDDAFQLVRQYSK